MLIFSFIETLNSIIFLARKIFYGTKKSWTTTSERRQFFVGIAEELEFNPYVAENWYTLARSTILKKKVIQSGALYYLT